MLRFLCDRNRHRAGWRFLRFTTTVTVKKSAEAEKRLDNSPSMPYNNHCCAGVAHLVERDLAKVEVASSSLVARSKKKHHPSGWCFLFGMPRAALNSLPRPARSALNQEVRQGSCEWLCHSWDAGSESSLVMFFLLLRYARRTGNKNADNHNRNTTHQGGVFLFNLSRTAIALGAILCIKNHRP